MPVYSSTTVGRPDLAITVEEMDLEMSQEGFVGQRILPVFDVDQQSADAQKIKLETLLENRDDARASDGHYNQASLQFEQWLYATTDRGIEFPIDERRAKIFRRFFDCETVATGMAKDVIKRNKEKRIAAKIMNTTTWATNETFTAGVPDGVASANTLVAGKFQNAASTNIKWSVYATATPIYDVLLAKQLVWKRTGLWPDAVVISQFLKMHLCQCAQIIDRIKYTRDPNGMTTAELAQALDVAEVIVAGESKNTADAKTAGAATTRTIAQIWDSTMASVVKIARKTTNPWDPGIGRTFRYAADGGDDNRVETYYSNEKRSDVIRVRDDVDEKIMYDAAACLITLAG